MPELNKKYNFNSLYICLLCLVYNIFIRNYGYINIILNLIINKIYVLDYTSFIIIINIIGLYLFLKNISFEISIKYKYL
jgi:hypothetical protein